MNPSHIGWNGVYTYFTGRLSSKKRMGSYHLSDGGDGLSKSEIQELSRYATLVQEYSISESYYPIFMLRPLLETKKIAIETLFFAKSPDERRCIDSLAIIVPVINTKSVWAAFQTIPYLKPLPKILLESSPGNLNRKMDFKNQLNE